MTRSYFGYSDEPEKPRDAAEPAVFRSHAGSGGADAFRGRLGSRARPRTLPRPPEKDRRPITGGNSAAISEKQAR